MENASRLIILLHGVGGRGDQFLAPGNRWKSVLPDALIEAPNGPYPFPVGNGCQWFSIVGVNEDNRAERIMAARGAFDHVIGGIIARNGFADRLDRVALIGFSQGSIMALDVVASGRLAVGAVVAFSGRLASPDPLSPSLATPVLLVHGSADTVIASEESMEAAKRFDGLGISVESHILPGIGHLISADGEKLAGEFLSRHLA